MQRSSLRQSNVKLCNEMFVNFELRGWAFDLDNASMHKMYIANEKINRCIFGLSIKGSLTKLLNEFGMESQYDECLTK